METSQTVPDDDPHGWPSVYEPDLMPAAQATAKPAVGAPTTQQTLEPSPWGRDNAHVQGGDKDWSEGANTPFEAPKEAEASDALAARGLGQGDSAGRRAYGKIASPAASTMSKILPHVDHEDMFPAFMSRSALFGALRPNLGDACAGPLKAAGDVSLTFQGPRLSMADKRVWEALIRIAKRDRIDASEPFDARLSEVARLAGYGQGQSRAAWASIERLARSKLDATVYGAKANGWLVMSSERRGRIARVRFDPAFILPALSLTMQASMAGAVGDGARSLLGQWLRDYLSTHKPPARPLTLGYLRELSGYVSKPKHFVAALEAAMNELASVRPDLVASWSIDKGEAVGNASDRWTLLAIRGPAMPVVKHPPKAAPAEAPAATTATKRRGGPSL